MKCFLLFIVGSMVFGAAAIGIGVGIWGDEMLTEAVVAFALAFLPAAGTMAWVLHSYRAASSDMRLLASLGGTGFRMAIALGGAFFLKSSQPEIFKEPFLYWLALFYLVLLAFEMTVLLKHEPKLNGSPQA
jgi:hypothetical protein